MFWIILTLALVLSIAMIVMVLLQPSKGGGITAAFGGIGGTLGSTFGQRRTLEALGKGTTYLAIGVAALCLLANLFFLPSGGGVQTATEGTAAPMIEQNPGVPSSDMNLETESSAPATSDDAAPAAEGDAATPPAGDQSGGTEGE